MYRNGVAGFVLSVLVVLVAAVVLRPTAVGDRTAAGQARAVVTSSDPAKVSPRVVSSTPGTVEEPHLGPQLGSRSDEQSAGAERIRTIREGTGRAKVSTVARTTGLGSTPARTADLSAAATFARPAASSTPRVAVELDPLDARPAANGRSGVWRRLQSDANSGASR